MSNPPSGVCGRGVWGAACGGRGSCCWGNCAGAAAFGAGCFGGEACEVVAAGLAGVGDGAAAGLVGGVEEEGGGGERQDRGEPKGDPNFLVIRQLNVQGNAKVNGTAVRAGSHPVAA